MVVSREGRGKRAAVRPGHLDRLGLDHEVADGEHVPLPHQRPGPAALQAQALGAARIRLDLRLDGDHGVKRFFGLVLRRRGRRDQGQDHRSQKQAQPTHGALLYGSTIR